MRSSGFAIDVAFALDGLGFALAGGDGSVKNLGQVAVCEAISLMAA
jgi:hypothetical protein